MKRIGYFIVLLIGHLVAKAQYFSVEDYVLQTIESHNSNTKNSAFSLILANEGIQSGALLKKLEELSPESVDVKEKVDFFLAKASYYGKSGKFKIAIENTLFAIRQAEANGNKLGRDLAFFLQAGIYFKLNSFKNVVSTEELSASKNELSFQFHYLLAASYLKLGDWKHCENNCRVSADCQSSNYDLIQTYKVLALCKEKQSKYSEAISLSLKVDSIITVSSKQSSPSYLNGKLIYKDITSKNGQTKLAVEKIGAKNNLGYLYCKSANLSASEKILKQALAICVETNQESLLVDVKKNLALTTILQGQYRLADELLQSAEATARKINNTKAVSDILCIRARNQYLMNNPAAAKSLCDASIAMAELNRDYNQLAQSYQVLADINSYVGDIQKSNVYSRTANEYAQKARMSSNANAEEIANSLKEEASSDVFNKEKSDLELIQAKLLAKQRDQELEIFKRESQIKEANIISEKLETEKAQQALLIVQSQLQALNQRRELDEIRKDRAINILENKNNQNKIKLLNKQRKLDEAIRLQNEREVAAVRNRERNLLIFLAASLVVIGLIVVLLYRNIKNAKVIRLNNLKLEELSASLQSTNVALEATLQEVKVKNEIIELKNHQIVESINYSQRIQEASLPKATELVGAAKDCFVIYKPKDIISGDFYLVSTQKDPESGNQFSFYMVGDCTGHGVPGAMLSLLCNSLIRQSLTQRNLRSPAQLLNEVNRRLRNFFRNKELDNFKDGMDIACCLYDKAEMKMYFAGAGRPLYCVRDSELVELKGDKNHIGFSNVSHFFNDQVIDVREDDIIYLFTDGYTDQFNGLTRKRFTTRNLKKMLTDVSTKSLAEQATIVNDRFVQWQGDFVQMDDVCLLGIKL